MRHAKHRHQLGRKKEHREALMANLAAALIRNKRIKTTLPKAKALRPFIEKIITLAKKADATDDKLRKHHFRKLALSRVRDIQAVNRLFNDLAGEFAKREGGYTRIYKLVPRLGDAADMALIEFIDAEDEGYGKRKSKATKKSAKESAAVDAEAKEESTEEDAAPAKEEAAEAVEAPAEEEATPSAVEPEASEGKDGEEAPEAKEESKEEEK